MLTSIMVIPNDSKTPIILLGAFVHLKEIKSKISNKWNCWCLWSCVMIPAQFFRDFYFVWECFFFSIDFIFSFSCNLCYLFLFLFPSVILLGNSCSSIILHPPLIRHTVNVKSGQIYPMKWVQLTQNLLEVYSTHLKRVLNSVLKLIG